MNIKEMIINHINDLDKRINTGFDSEAVATLMEAKSIALLALINVKE